jgi:hypothetical protein
MAPARNFRGFFVGPPKFGRSKEVVKGALFKVRGQNCRANVSVLLFFW